MESQVLLSWPGWIRWILFLPVSVLSYLCVYWGVVIGSKLLDFFSRPGPGWGNNFFELILAPAFAGYFAIEIPMRLAPSQRYGILLSLMALWTVAYGALAGLFVFAGNWKFLLAVVISLIGAFSQFFARAES